MKLIDSQQQQKKENKESEDYIASTRDEPARS